MNYLLIDSRGGTKCAMQFTCDLNEVSEDWERYILSISKDAREICNLANKGELGDNCVVANEKGTILWGWFSTGIWEENNNFKNKKP